MKASGGGFRRWTLLFIACCVVLPVFTILKKGPSALTLRMAFGSVLSSALLVGMTVLIHPDRS